MKGIILAGGEGTRLRPMTLVTSKQLLPVYDQPMIFYPLKTLLQAGITEVLIIVAPDRAGDYLRVLGSGKEWNAKFTYEIQDKPGGLAEAFVIGADFIDDQSVTLVLGDNIFLGGDAEIRDAITSFKTGGRIFAKQVPDPERFGVIEFDSSGKVISIEEKPPRPKSNFASIGLYVYDNRVISIARKLKPSARGELEITDLHKAYLAAGELDVRVFTGEWLDTGTPDSLLAAGNMIAQSRSSGAKPSA
ncbi:MAG: NTP transferase domain-containing protein [Candidatus Kerfeldbacteria bacterium]|nr:NTP transferase domain-containing protein [Candidatus Kerfeldbacteria bacterium]